MTSNVRVCIGLSEIDVRSGTLTASPTPFNGSSMTSVNVNGLGRRVMRLILVGAERLGCSPGWNECRTCVAIHSTVLCEFESCVYSFCKLCLHTRTCLWRGGGNLGG